MCQGRLGQKVRPCQDSHRNNNWETTESFTLEFLELGTAQSHGKGNQVLQSYLAPPSWAFLGQRV